MPGMVFYWRHTPVQISIFLIIFFFKSIHFAYFFWFLSWLQPGICSDGLVLGLFSLFFPSDSSGYEWKIRFSPCKILQAQQTQSLCYKGQICEGKKRKILWFNLNKNLSFRSCWLRFFPSSLIEMRQSVWSLQTLEKYRTPDLVPGIFSSELVLIQLSWNVPFQIRRFLFASLRRRHMLVTRSQGLWNHHKCCYCLSNPAPPHHHPCPAPFISRLNN